MAQTKLLSVLWKQSSPYSTFASGDTVIVYWDDSTNAFAVEKNGVTITSGTQIPITFIFSGQWNYYYKLEKVFQNQICQTGSLLQFTRISNFPYLTVKTFPNHPACDILGIDQVCDIAFASLPVVANSSTPTTADGSIAVTANSSHGSVKFRLNADFNYYDSTGQTSGTFTGLLPGTYNIYCRDEINCLSVVSATVAVTYTYGVRFRIEYANALGYTMRSEILEKDYSGSVTDIECGPLPAEFNLRGEGEKDKFIPVFATEMIMNLISVTDGQFQDLFTNDPEKFRIRQSVDDGGGYDILWIGKVLPQEYSEEFKSEPYNVTVTATDGIPQLKDLPFLDAEGNRLRGRYKQIEIIAWILAKLNLGLSIRSGLNLYATGMDVTDTDDPLDQAYADVATYYLSSETPTCMDVIEKILTPYGASLKAYNNVWNIVRIEELLNDYDYREYTSAGVYSTNSTYAPVKDIKQKGNINCLHWANRDARLDINPGFGGINLQYDMGLKPNLIENGDFTTRKYSAFFYSVGDEGGKPVLQTEVLPDMTGFELVSNGTIIEKSIESLDGSNKENVALVLTSKAAGGYLLTDTINFKMSGENSLRITLKFKVTTLQYFPPRYIKVKIVVKYGTLYLQDNGQWTTTSSAIGFFIKKEELGKYQNLNIVAPYPNDTVYLTTGADFFIKIYQPNTLDYDYTSYTDLRAKATTSLGQGYRTEVYSTFTIYYYELKNSTNTESSPDIIRPNDYHVTTNPYQWILVDKVLKTVGDYTSLSIDTISLEYLSNGKLLPKQQAYNKPLENANNTVLNKIIYHGSVIANGRTVWDYGDLYKPELKFIGGRLVSVNTLQGKNYEAGYIAYTSNSAEIIYVGYLSDSTGTGYTTWGRDLLTGEAKNLEDIFLDMYAVQYNRAWRRITGSIYSQQTTLTPLDSIEDFTNGNRKYFPVSLRIDFRGNMYSGEFLELFDPTDGVGFTTGFSYGFDA